MNRQQMLQRSHRLRVHQSVETNNETQFSKFLIYVQDFLVLTNLESRSNLY